MITLLKQFFWICPNRNHRRRDCQRFPVAIQNRATIGRYRHFSQIAFVALRLIKLFAYHLDIERARKQAASA